MSDQLLRLAFVTYEFPPVVDGGAGTYAGALVAELVALGHDVSVFTRAGAIVPRGASLVPVSLASGGFWRHLPGAVSSIARSVGPFDVLHGNGVADMALRRSRSTARVVTLHHRSGQNAQRGWRGILRRLSDVRGESGLILPLACD